MANNILLCSTLHDPKGGLAGTFPQAYEVIKESGGAGWVINVTPGTSEEVKKELASLASAGVYMIETQSDPAHRLSKNFICDDHLRAVQKAAEIATEQGIKKILYLDGDRMNMAARNYPDEFRSMIDLAVKTIGEEGSYVNFRRPRKEYLGHQAPLYATERVFNRLYSEAFGMPIDIGSTLHGMSLDVADEIVKRAPSTEVEYPHPTFLIAAKEAGANIQSYEVAKVLTCETPEQSRKGVEAKLGREFSSYEELQKVWKATTGLELLYSLQEWERRFKLEGQYLRVLEGHLPNFGLNDEKEQELLIEIRRAQETMEQRKTKILETLSRTPEGLLQARKERGRKALLEKSGLERE